MTIRLNPVSTVMRATLQKLITYLLLCYIRLLLTAPLPRPEPAPIPPSVAQAAIATLTFIHAGVIGIALAHRSATDSLISKSRISRRLSLDGRTQSEINV